ncbi:MAG: leucine-rich repeat domain-containing protein [Candidatus Peribacteria bacterium]|jgi:hypothetical protein|nr:leucine-rich repeat domain-containing protein [Candidatus Peribacteria bacterium]
MANYYEEFVGQEVAKVWENIANELAKQYGTDPEKFQHTSLIEGSSRPVSEFADKFEDYLNDKLMVTPVNNNGDPTENIKKIGTQIKKDLKFEEKEDKEEEERKKLTRLKEIKEKITNQIFIDALKETTKESESLSLRGIDNKDLNKNRDTIIELLPKLKNLKIEGTKSDQLSTDSLARNKLEDNILQFFRENIETLELPNNYFTDLNWLRGESQLKKIDLSDNGITTINYDDFQDLPKGCEIILKGNNPISQET